jgi:hypothetical protein
LGKVLRIPDSQPLLAPRIAPEVFEAVSEALYHERKLHIHYRNARGKRKQATVWPLGVVQQGVRLYLVCRFEGYDNERILALPRLVQAQASNEAFPWPKGFDLKRYCLEDHSSTHGLMSKKYSPWPLAYIARRLLCAQALPCPAARR